jgi:putative DNA primase/helicase
MNGAPRENASDPAQAIPDDPTALRDGLQRLGYTALVIDGAAVKFTGLRCGHPGYLLLLAGKIVDANCSQNCFLRDALIEQLQVAIQSSPAAEELDSTNGNADGAAEEPEPPLQESPPNTDGQPPKPKPIPPCFENFPVDLQNLKQWVNWRYEWRADKQGKHKWTKPPYQPNGKFAKANNPNTWSDFDTVRKAYQSEGFDGVGFAPSRDDPFVIFDLDHCLNDQGTIIDPQFTDYVKRLASYTERSPGGDGLRVIVKAKLPAGRRRKGHFEVYNQEHYLTITGNTFPIGSAPLPIVERQVEVEAIHAQVFAEKKQPEQKQQQNPQSQSHPEKTDSDELDEATLLSKARAAKNGSKFTALYDQGHRQSQGFNSTSEADLSLCYMLAFWTGRNRDRMDSLFRKSALFRDKWNRDDYREKTLNEAIRGCKQIYRKPVALFIKDSMALARSWADRTIELPEGRILQRWQNKFWRWNGACYAEENDEIIRTEVWNFLRDEAHLQDKDRKQVLPQAHTVNETLDALRAHCQLPAYIPTPPCWIGNASLKPDTGTSIPVRNGLLALSTRELRPPNPQWFDFCVINTNYDEHARCDEWIKFLTDLWPEDHQSRACLQEIFGYLLTSDMSQQKSFMLIGPRRSGKGTIARILAALLGSEAVVKPALADFTFQFGLECLINKTLAIMSDTRDSNPAAAGMLAERLLAISGEDSLSVPRKYLPAWNGPLRVRFLLLSNQLPAFADASGALPGRFILLRTTKSYFDKEDPTLFSRLSPELPGILNWALDGWERLQERGHFVQPDAVKDMVQDLANIANPLAIFIDDACELHSEKSTTIGELHRQYVDWCRDRAMKPDYITIFSRNLRAAHPEFHFDKPHNQPRRICGIAPSLTWRAEFTQRHRERRDRV